VTDIHESTGSYAVDALDAAELDEFEAHLAACPICRAEVAELCEVAAELSVLNLATPPTRLRDSVLTAIRRTPQLSVLNGAAKHPPSVSLDGSGPVNGSHPAVDSRAMQPVGARRALPEPGGPDVPGR